MLQQLRDAWVATLRSDQFKQGRGSLHKRTADGEDTYCAFGVLLKIDPDVVGIGSDSAIDKDGKHIKTEDLTTRYGISPGQLRDVIKYNDAGLNFKQLADYIEREVT